MPDHVHDERREQLERVLALGRLTLVLLVATLLRLHGTGGRPPTPLLLLVVGYAGYAMSAAAAVALARSRVVLLGVVLHWLDVAWVLPITALTEGPSSVFLIFYVFALVGAAYRWGLRQTAATGIITAIALLAQAAALELGLAHQPSPTISLVLTRSVHAIGLGLLIGYLADDQHQTRARLAVATRVLSAVNASNGLRGSIAATLGELVAVFGARSAVLSVTDREAGTTYRWELAAGGGSLVLAEHPAEAGGEPNGADPAVASVYTLYRRSGRLQVRDDRGSRAARADIAAVVPADARTALVAASPFVDGWMGRLVLTDPAHHTSARERRWLSTLLPQVGLALYNVYLLGRLRSRATAMERARLARELHDGVIQSLVGLEMHVDVLRRRMEPSDAAAALELGQIQSRLRAEAVSVRELMNEIRPVSGDPRDVPDLIAGIADRFERDTGIETRFVCTVPSVPLPPSRVRELVRIVQESLVNVRKHSGARVVILRLGVSSDGCVLTVDDDGRGFEFEGHFTLDELDAVRRGPHVIKERVRQLGGNMVLDSARGRGSRLEIHIPRHVV